MYDFVTVTCDKCVIIANPNSEFKIKSKINRK